MVLLVVPDVCNPFYSAMAREVQRLAGARGYAMALFNTGERAQEEEEAVRLARQMYAGGILFASVDSAGAGHARAAGQRHPGRGAQRLCPRAL